MGLFDWLSGGSGNTKGIQALNSQLQPLFNQLQSYANYGFESGKADYTKAGETLQIPIDYYKDILGGDFDKILKTLNSDEVVRNYDDQSRMISEFGLRGGNRAASASQNEFNKQSILNTTLENARASAPEHLAQLGQILAGIAQGKIQLTDDVKSIIQGLLNVQGFRENASARKAGAIQGLLNSLSTAAGAIAGGGG